MRVLRVLVPLFVVVCLAVLAGESKAVIYKYTTEKGDLIYVDDLIKVPEQERGKAVIVTGKEELELVDDAERLRALEARREAIDRQPFSRHAAEPFRSRLLRSALATAAVIAVLFVLINFDALKEKEKLVRKTRIALIAVLVLFIGYTHAGDVIGLFRSAGDAAPSPIAHVRDKQAEKGRRAAAAYKNMDRILNESIPLEVERVQRQFDEADEGR